jgi:hypothetical protein
LLMLNLVVHKVTLGVEGLKIGSYLQENTSVNGDCVKNCRLVWEPEDCYKELDVLHPVQRPNRLM